jgi:hypothetical protein
VEFVENRAGRDQRVANEDARESSSSTTDYDMAEEDDRDYKMDLEDQIYESDEVDDSQTPVAGARAWSSQRAGRLRHSFDTGAKYNYRASTSCQMIAINQGGDPYAALEAAPGNTRHGRALRRTMAKLAPSKKAPIKPAGRPGKDAKMLLKKAKQRTPKLQQNGC